MTKKISVIIGSLRRESFARKIALNAMEWFPENYEPKIVEIGHLPLYNLDYDDPKQPDVELPESYKEFRQTIKDSAGILFVTPENNRTIPACLKNAVDIGSKPNDDVAWLNKPTGIMTHSVGKMGGYSGHKNLRLALSYFQMPITGQPEVFIGNSHDIFDENNKIKVESTVEFIKKYLKVYIDLVEQYS